MNMSRVLFYKTPIGCEKQDGRCEGKKAGRKEEEAFNKGKFSRAKAK